MNMNKKQLTMLAIGIIAVVGIYFIFFRRKKDDGKKESSFNPDYLVIGEESGYLVCKPECAYDSWYEITKVPDGNTGNFYEKKTLKEACICPKKDSKNSSNYTGESSYTKTCTGIDGKPRKCPPPSGTDAKSETTLSEKTKYIRNK